MKSFGIAVSLTAAALSLGSCTARYQDLLRDRDAQIVDLQGEVADLRATNADLERTEKNARDALASASVEVAGPQSDLERVQEDLADLDVRYSRGRLSIGIENTVTFSSGSVALKKSAHQTLQRVADVLKREFSDRRIYVEGHTDTDPIRKTKGRFRSNRHLSAERADAVAAFLIGQGAIGEQQIAVVGYGAFDPRDDGKGDAAKARNRRVEIVIGEPL